MKKVSSFQNYLLDRIRIALTVQFQIIKEIKRIMCTNLKNKNNGQLLKKKNITAEKLFT
jgi:hypothetical protein